MKRRKGDAFWPQISYSSEFQGIVEDNTEETSYFIQ